jgi:hypothetical protein
MAIQRRRNIYIALENFDFLWDEDDLVKIRELWDGGIHLQDMAKYLKRPAAEVFCILLDQSHKGFLRHRKGGLYGCMDQLEPAKGRARIKT